jgi:hypothetical protein
VTYVDPLTVGCWVCGAPEAAPCVFKHGDLKGQPLPNGNVHPPRHTAADTRLTDRDHLRHAFLRLVERLDTDAYTATDLDLARRLGAWGQARGI